MGGRGRELCLTLGSRCWREAGKAVIPGWGGSLCLPQEGEDSKEKRSLGAFHVPSASRAQRAPGRIGSHQPTCSHSQKLPW